nr:DNA/RNA non-specific endonuclease [Asticcacaulis machinosus]
MSAGISPDDLVAALEGKHVTAGSRLESTDDGRNFALEAIIERIGRPSYLIQANEINWKSGAPFPVNIKESASALQPFFRSTGRIRAINHPTKTWLGTVWLVENDDGKPLAITNRHVANAFAERRAGGAAVFSRLPSLAPLGAVVDFCQEERTADVFEASVKSVRYLAADTHPDIAVLELEDSAHLGPRLQLADREALRDELIASVGYPARDSRNDGSAQRDIFGTVFGKKRIAPGYVTQAVGRNTLISHDASTLGGSSGSAIVALDGNDQGRVLGLHFAGEYLETNYAVSVASLRNALRNTSVPVNQPMPSSADGEGQSDGKHDVGHFDGRDGYDPNFLKTETIVFELPLPKPPGDELAELIGKPGTHELKYTHFSVLYSKVRRAPRLTAVNIDGRKSVKIKRGDDKWFADLRIAEDLQLTRKDFPGDFDRGHLVRREDPNWGDQATAELADTDTFHYTNAALQHALLNRNKQRWLGLEDYVLNSARTFGFRATVFCGPILKPDDPELKERDGIQVPLAFWKVIVMVAADKRRLHTTGYVLGQADFVRTLTESFEFGDFNQFQVPIDMIEKHTDITFGLPVDADPLKKSARNLSETEYLRVVPIGSYEDLIL